LLEYQTLMLEYKIMEHHLSAVTI